MTLWTLEYPKRVNRIPNLYKGAMLAKSCYQCTLMSAFGKHGLARGKGVGVHYAIGRPEGT